MCQQDQSIISGYAALILSPMTSQKGKSPEKLDVEDEEERLARLQNTLEKLNTNALPTVEPGSSQRPNLEAIWNHSASATAEVDESSLQQLLQRVQAFLPRMEASNTELAQMVAADPRSVDIENVDGDREVIQMVRLVCSSHPLDHCAYFSQKLGLGLFEERNGTETSSEDSSSDPDSDSDTDTMSSVSESSDNSTSSSSDDSDESESEASHHSRPIRPLPRRARPEIEVISETTFPE
ncbi:unnamed protein product [Mycena citricolor]|uniref:Uncharacterized protein n=1 Tax=Mycena citricolor TaxID=2018698 RepID=A0AAD2Q499_9AGAR|nr:unnamed protein product [Mycena citricolor]